MAWLWALALSHWQDLGADVAACFGDAAHLLPSSAIAYDLASAVTAAVATGAAAFAASAAAIRGPTETAYHVPLAHPVFASLLPFAGGWRWVLCEATLPTAPAHCASPGITPALHPPPPQCCSFRSTFSIGVRAWASSAPSHECWPPSAPSTLPTSFWRTSSRASPRASRTPSAPSAGSPSTGARRCWTPWTPGQAPHSAALGSHGRPEMAGINGAHLDPVNPTEGPELSARTSPPTVGLSGRRLPELRLGHRHGARPALPPAPGAVPVDARPGPRAPARQRPQVRVCAPRHISVLCQGEWVASGWCTGL